MWWKKLKICKNRRNRKNVDFNKNTLTFDWYFTYFWKIYLKYVPPLNFFMILVYLRVFRQFFTVFKQLVSSLKNCHFFAYCELLLWKIDTNTLNDLLANLFELDSIDNEKKMFALDLIIHQPIHDHHHFKGWGQRH